MEGYILSTPSFIILNVLNKIFVKLHVLGLYCIKKEFHCCYFYVNLYNGEHRRLWRILGTMAPGQTKKLRYIHYVFTHQCPCTGVLTLYA